VSISFSKISEKSKKLDLRAEHARSDKKRTPGLKTIIAG
jgi:hypothetical protein